MTIGIIGMGYVGSAVYANLKPEYRKMCRTYDKYKEGDWHSFDDVADCDIVFVCVSTPSREDGSIDDTAVTDILVDLEGIQGTVILKSTILEDRIPDMYNLVYNPEFLNQRTSITDFRDQVYIILGGDISATIKVEEAYQEAFAFTRIIKYEHCSIREASDFKYIRNIYSAYKVLFWEFVQDTTGDSRKMSMMLENLPIGENTQVGMDAVRGFNGACLPKDTAAFHNEFHHVLTKFMLEYNERLDD